VERGELIASKYSIVFPLFALPLYALGKLTNDPAGWAARCNVLFLAGLLLFFWRAFRPALGPAVTRSFLLVLALCVALGRKMWTSRRLRYALLAFLAVGLVGLECWAKRGAPYLTGYEG